MARHVLEAWAGEVKVLHSPLLHVRTLLLVVF